MEETEEKGGAEVGRSIDVASIGIGTDVITDERGKKAYLKV